MASTLRSQLIERNIVSFCSMDFDVKRLIIRERYTSNRTSALLAIITTSTQNVPLAPFMVISNNAGSAPALP